MRKKLEKIISICMVCLTLMLLLNVVTQKSNSITLVSTQIGNIISNSQDGPWG